MVISTYCSAFWTLPAKSSPGFKLGLHIAVGILLFPAIICGVVRIAGGGRNAATNVIGQSLKSYVFLLYIALSERHPRFKKFANVKAYAVLNCLEILFWAVTFGLAAQGAGSGCTHRYGCVAAGILVALCLVLWFIFIYSTYIYTSDFRRSKHGDSPKDPRINSTKTLGDAGFIAV